MSSARGSEIRAVLDTNVLVSALTHPHGRVAPLWRAARDHRYQILVSPVIVSEVGKALRTVFGWDERRITNRLKLLSKIGEIIVPRTALHVIRNDPDDNRILECAVEGKANVIVSGDHHLRDLKSYRGIPVVRSIDFLRTLGVV
jgi:uncharacterized protein